MDKKMVKKLIELELVAYETITFSEYTMLNDEKNLEYRVYKFRIDDVLNYYKIKNEDVTPEQLDMQFKFTVIERMKKIEHNNAVLTAMVILLFVFLVLIVLL